MTWDENLSLLIQPYWFGPTDLALLIWPCWFGPAALAAADFDAASTAASTAAFTAAFVDAFAVAFAADFSVALFAAAATEAGNCRRWSSSCFYALAASWADEDATTSTAASATAATAAYALLIQLLLQLCWFGQHVSYYFGSCCQSNQNLAITAKEIKTRTEVIMS